MALVNTQGLYRTHVVTADRLLTPGEAAAQVVALSDLDLYEMLHYAEEMGLGANFYHPEFFDAGMLPHDVDIANSFHFSCVKYLVRGDGTEADPVPGECACGIWLFHAYGCGDVFKAYDVICGATVTSGTAITVKACKGTKGHTHRAKVKVLGPCGERSCTWWAEREAGIQDMANRLANDFYMDRAWPPMDQDDE